jgi:hypothetical protein
MLDLPPRTWRELLSRGVARRIENAQQQRAEHAAEGHAPPSKGSVARRRRLATK